MKKIRFPRNYGITPCLLLLPVEAPRIAVAVIVENGGHGGSVAAPIARKVMDYYLLPDIEAAEKEKEKLVKDLERHTGYLEKFKRSLDLE